MNRTPGVSVSGALAAVLRVSRCACAAPLRVMKLKSSWRISPSPSLAVFGHVVMTIIGILMLWSLVVELQLQQLPQLQTRPRRLVWLVKTAAMTLAAGVVVHGAPRRMQLVMSTLNDVHQINSKLNVKEQPTTRHGSLLAFLIFSMFTFAADYIVFILSTLTMPEGQAWLKASRLLYYLFFGTIELGLLQFALVALHARSCFKAVNGCLTSMLQGNTKNVNKQHQRVHAVAAAYASACDVVSDVARGYGAMLMSLLTTVFLHLVTRPYYFIVNLFVESNLLDNHTMGAFEVIQLLWCIFHTINLVLVVEPCYLTHVETAHTRELVSRLMLRVSSVEEPVAVALRQFCRQLVSREATYQLLGVRLVTRGLVLAMLANIATYLVILVDTD